MDTPAVRTTCPYCGVGCGVLATPGDDGTVAIAGDPEHPANFGRLCSKGSALGETVHLDGRLLEPQIGGKAASWDKALDLVASRFNAVIREHGPDSVAFYVSGQLLTEDYYVANKLMKGFIGSANIDTNSRLCMSSSVAGHMRAFGSDTVPGTYEDLELADLIVLTGSNLAWCHPVLYQRIAAAKVRRPQMRVVLIDPRRTMTADIADMHLPIRADGDTALFVGLLGFLAKEGALDHAYIERHTTGFAAALALASFCDLDVISQHTGITPDQLLAFFTLFARTERCVTVYSQGVNQSASGTDKVNAIINCHLATGRIGRPGMGPFSVTGQPNAMGGREVGGLANLLSAHRDLANPAHRAEVAALWGVDAVPSRPGKTAVEMFEAAAEGEIDRVPGGRGFRRGQLPGDAGGPRLHAAAQAVLARGRLPGGRRAGVHQHRAVPAALGAPLLCAGPGRGPGHRALGQRPARGRHRLRRPVAPARWRARRLHQQGLRPAVP